MHSEGDNAPGTLTDTPTNSIFTVAQQVYRPASNVLSGFRVCVKDGPEPLATSLLLGSNQWTVGATVQKGTSDTVHFRVCRSPAVSVE